MKEELIQELAGYRVGMDAAIRFANKNLPGSKGTDKFMEARSALGRVCFYLGSRDPYLNSAQTNSIIDDGADLSDFMDGSSPGYILSVKSMIKACEIYLGSVSKIRTSSVPKANITYTFLLHKSLDRCIDRLEDALGWYLRELRDWKNDNVEEYREVLKGTESIEVTVPKDAVKTDQLMQERSKK